MARVRRTSSDSPRAGPEPAAAVIPLTEIEAPTREGLAGMSDAERALLRELRRVMFNAGHCHPEFDHRRMLRDGITERQRAAWRRRRCKWLKKLFKDDPRVDVDA